MEYIRTFTRELEAQEPVELIVENRSGAVAVRGEDTKRVRIEVIAHLWGESEDEADDQAELIARSIRQEGQRVIARAPALLRPHPFLFFSRTPRVDYLISVPNACAASLTTRSGRVEVEHICGPLEVTARSGRVAVREIQNDVRISSSSGHTQVEAIAGSLVVDSRSGGVRVSGCKGNAQVHAKSGSIQIDEVRGNLDVQSRSGATSVSHAGGALRVSAMSGAIRYEGPVHGPFDIEVMSGSVRLALDPDSAFLLDAESSSGSVRSDLPLKRRTSPPPKDAPTVRIRARSGSIVLAQR